MGLELLDVADVIRPHPEVIDYLQQVRDDSCLGWNWFSLMVDSNLETPSMLISTNTECDVSEKSTSPGLAGAKNRRHLFR